MPRLRSYLVSAAVGALLLLCLFGLESLLLLRAGAIGVQVETAGPFAALLNAVRPHVPGLLLRIAALYAASGAVLFAAARLAAWALGRERWAQAWTALVGLLLVAGACWHAAVERPALFDDLPYLRGLFQALAARGEPWHPLLALGLLGVATVAGALWRARGVRWRPASRPLIAAAAVALVALGAAAWRRSARGPRAPLLVLIGVDAFRPDRLAANGARRRIAPNLDALVADSTLFTRAYTPIAQTEPAWRSLLTARWPQRTGVRYPLTASSRWQVGPTFVDAFARAGFLTSFRTDCSRFHFEDESSGFQIREQPPRGAVNFLLEKLRYRGVGVFGANALGSAWLPEMVDNRALAGIHHPFAYADRLAGALAAEARQGPLLFAFHATSAHFPGDPTYPFYRTLTDPASPLERRLRMVFSPVVRGGERPAGLTQRGNEALYDALIAQGDAQVGQLVDRLKTSGLYDEATIVLFSDHGESFHADHPDLEGATSVHGARLHDEENRILLAVKLPRSSKADSPRTVDRLVRLIDVGPTLLELAGLPALEGADGESLVPALRGEPIADRLVYAETGFTHVSPDVFDPAHAASAPRTFDAFRVRADGIVEVSDEAHQAILGEKDLGAFDGAGWLIRSPRRGGLTEERCHGTCAPTLAAFLDQVSKP